MNEFKPDAELQALLDSMKESFEWEAEQNKTMEDYSNENL
jgi:hypothetical protein